MRLPYLQIANEVLDQVAPDLAVKLGCSEAVAGWGVLRLFRWALGRCPEDGPPSAYDVIEDEDAALLVANAAGHKGDPELYVRACSQIRPAVLERTEGGIRIRGLDRYDAAWGKSNPELWKLYKMQREFEASERIRPEPGAKPGGLVPGPPENGADAARKTKMQTQIEIQKEKEETPPTVKVTEPGTPLRAGATIDAPTTEPDGWSGLEFWQWAQSIRQSGGLLAERPPHHRKLSAWWSEAQMRNGVTVKALKDGFFAFGQSKFWEATTPPYPFHAFMAQWDQFTQPEVSDGAPA